MKKIVSILFSLLLLFNSSTYSAKELSDSEVLNWRDDFLWGQNISNPKTGYDSDEKYSEEYIYLAAKQGVKLIRYGHDQVTDDFTECDKVVGLCNKYGIKVMLVIKPGGYGFDEPTQEDLDFIEKCAKVYAERYDGKDGRGKVDYFQLWNELEIKLMRAKFGSGAVDGDLTAHYYDLSVEGSDDLVEWSKVMDAASKGIRSAKTDAKIVINFGWSCFGAIRYYYENGVDFDYIGWDYYPDTYVSDRALTRFEQFLYKGWMDDYGNWHEGLRTVIPDKDIIVCEANTYVKGVPDYNDDYLTEEQYEPLWTVANAAYNYPCIKGFCVYTLTDSPSHADASEKYFGFVRVEKGGKVTEPKPIYYTYQQLIGGNSSIERISKDSIDLKPYEVFKVLTQDDSNVNQVEQDTELPSNNNFTDNNFDSIEENKTELEPIIETVTIKPDDIYKKTTSTITQRKMPWILMISVGVGMLVLFGVGLAIFILIRRKNINFPK